MKILAIFGILFFSLSGFSAPIYEPISIKERVRLDLWYHGLKDIDAVSKKRVQNNALKPQ